jgi:hypothetical protein
MEPEGSAPSSLELITYYYLLFPEPDKKTPIPSHLFSVCQFKGST